MADLRVGAEIRIITPLTITRIGTADLEVEYSAGAINKKLYIPKNICEAITITQVIAAGYKCDICGKICKAAIGLAGHKRSHK